MTRELLVLIEGKVAGSLIQDNHGAISFEYEDSYQSMNDSTPLSISMPLVQKKHKGTKLANWLKNLLPDNEGVLSRWAIQYKVSPSNPFALLEHVGRDVVGAVQFVPMHTVANLQDGGLTPLTIGEVENRLKELEANPAAWTPSTRSGQFSLPGAQAKTALRFVKGQWSEPWGSEPTTHIIKPPSRIWPHQEINEHLSLETSRLIGIPTADSEIMSFGTKRALVVTRYDRFFTESGDIRRIHQEDLCQALGLSSTMKYEVDQGSGPGPGVSKIIELIRKIMGPLEAANAVRTFIQALAYAWVIGGTDAHAKNYAILLSGPNLRFAPLYDLNSILPYEVAEVRNLPQGQASFHDSSLAMRIGSHRKIREVTGEDWRELAETNSLDPEEVRALVLEVIKVTPPAMKSAIERFPDSVMNPGDRRFANELLDLVAKQAGVCRTSMDGRGIPNRHR